MSDWLEDLKAGDNRQAAGDRKNSRYAQGWHMSPKRFNPFDWVSWWSLGYRALMKVAHRYHWHYAPPCYPEGDTHLWCQWCGFRQTIKRASPEQKT